MPEQPPVPHHNLAENDGTIDITEDIIDGMVDITEDISASAETITEENVTVFNAGLPHQVYTMIKGRQHTGLLVDPGASKALIGSDTLHEIFNKILKPRKLMHMVIWGKSKSSFTGISSDVQQSLGVVRFPLGLLGVRSAFFSTDVVGGPSSSCPGLVPLRTLINHHCLIACGHFPNGDGLLIISVRDDRGRNRLATQLLYLTDSGHYLLPIDNFGQAAGRNLAKHGQNVQDALKSAARGHDQSATDVALVLRDAALPITVSHFNTDEHYHENAYDLENENDNNDGSEQLFQ